MPPASDAKRLEYVLRVNDEATRTLDEINRRLAETQKAFSDTGRGTAAAGAAAQSALQGASEASNRAAASLAAAGRQSLTMADQFRGTGAAITVVTSSAAAMGTTTSGAFGAATRAAVSLVGSGLGPIGIAAATAASAIALLSGESKAAEERANRLRESYSRAADEFTSLAAAAADAELRLEAKLVGEDPVVLRYRKQAEALKDTIRLRNESLAELTPQQRTGARADELRQDIAAAEREIGRVYNLMSLAVKRVDLERASTQLDAAREALGRARPDVRTPAAVGPGSAASQIGQAGAGAAAEAARMFSESTNRLNSLRDRFTEMTSGVSASESALIRDIVEARKALDAAVAAGAPNVESYRAAVAQLEEALGLSRKLEMAQARAQSKRSADERRDAADAETQRQQRDADADQRRTLLAQSQAAAAATAEAVRLAERRTSLVLGIERTSADAVLALTETSGEARLRLIEREYDDRIAALREASATEVEIATATAAKLRALDAARAELGTVSSMRSRVSEEAARVLDNPNSTLGDGMAAESARMIAELPTAAEQGADGIRLFRDSAVSSLTDVVMHTRSASEAFREMGRNLVASAVETMANRAVTEFLSYGLSALSIGSGVASASMATANAAGVASVANASSAAAAGAWTLKGKRAFEVEPRGAAPSLGGRMLRGTHDDGGAVNITIHVSAMDGQDAARVLTGQKSLIKTIARQGVAEGMERSGRMRERTRRTARS